MGRIARTFSMAGASWRVLKADKELVFLPILSLLATLGTVATFIWPIFRKCGVDPAGEAICQLTTTDYIVLGVMYVVLAFITIFFNAALIHAANERMSGGDPTVGGALRAAALKVHRILPWAILSATVSLILRAVHERGGVVGKVVSSIAGIAWSLVTFLVIPVLVIEDVGLKEAVKRSGAMFRRTWGENVAAQVGFGLVGMLLMLPAMGAAAMASVAGGAIAVVMVSSAILWIVLVSMVMAAMAGIFQAALYRYAAGLDSAGFSSGALDAAFTPRAGGTGSGPGPIVMPPGIGG